MIKILISILLATVTSIPITLGMGLIYFIVASFFVNFFKLNTGLKPIGFKVFNFAVLITFLTFFVSFAILVRRF